MKRSYQKVPISKAPGEILIFPLEPFFISVYLGFEWVTLNHFPFLEGRAGQIKHLFHQ
jgi:hypothetical protein